MPVFYNIHSHHNSTSEDVITIRSFMADEDVDTSGYFSTGIHPWYIENPQKQLENIKSCLSHKKLLAIGECGLDKLKGPGLEDQKKVFTWQVDISEEIKKPLIIHSVKTHHLILELQKSLQPTQNWIIHGFNSKPETARQLTDSNIHISLGTSLLNQPDRLRDLLKGIPGDMLLFETDDEPAETIKKLYRFSEKVNAKIPGMIQQNAKKIFHI